MDNDFNRYVKLKQLIPAEVGVRSYERQLKARIRDLPLPPETIDDLEPLILTGVERTDLRIPKNWIVNDNGVIFIKPDGGRQVATEFPMYVKTIIHNLRNFSENSFF